MEAADALPCAERGEGEEGGPEVGAAGDPGDGLDAGGMQREERGAQRGGGDGRGSARVVGAQAGEEPAGDEQGAREVERDVDRVVAPGAQPEELELHGECSGNKRAVVRAAAEVGAGDGDVPEAAAEDLGEGGEVAHPLVGDDEELVVPDEAARERRCKGERGGREDHRDGRDPMAREGGCARHGADSISGSRGSTRCGDVPFHHGCEWFPCDACC
ncbi:MAG: hypothetical protein IPN17_16375 [Deltaproteobacteria bacterium]|nr:hypothetical protein [Deltaproteobacteria bacterium]